MTYTTSEITNNQNMRRRERRPTTAPTTASDHTRTFQADNTTMSATDERTWKNLRTVSVPGPPISRATPSSTTSVVSTGWSLEDLQTLAAHLVEAGAVRQGMRHVAVPKRWARGPEILPSAAIASQIPAHRLDAAAADLRLNGRRVVAVERDPRGSRDLPRVHGVVIADLPSADDGDDRKRERQQAERRARAAVDAGTGPPAARGRRRGRTTSSAETSLRAQSVRRAQRRTAGGRVRVAERTRCRPRRRRRSSRATSGSR